MPAVELEDVLHGERVDVDDERLELRLARELRVVVDLVALGGDEQEIHLPGLGPPAQHLVVDLHVLDVEGDVLLGLPLDLLVELGRRSSCGTVILRMITDCPLTLERDVALLDLRVARRRAPSASTTACAFMTWPSTIVCGGSGA